MKKIMVMLFLVFFLQAFAQMVNTSISRGNQYYKQEQYDLAEAEYRKALRADPDNQTAQYNLANTLQKLKRYDEAIEILGRLSEAAEERKFRSTVHYNQGVAYTKQKKLDESIEAYKQALRLDPDDQQARENLQKALMEKKKQQQQQQQKKQQNESSMSQSEAQRRLQELEEKEKRLQQKLQSRMGGRPQAQDW